MQSKFSITEVLRTIVLLVLVAWCFYIVRPFLLVILWAIILAVALYPGYFKWLNYMGEKRRKIATILFTLITAILIFVPTYFMISALVENTQLAISQIRDNSLQIPKPEATVKDWPVIGEKLYTEWDKLSVNVKEYAVEHRDYLLEKGKTLLSSVSGFIGSLITFAISFLIAIVFMYHSESSYATGQKFMHKLVGNRSAEIMLMSRDTIRSVVKGILLVALIQGVFSFIGFKAIGLPAAGIFALVVLITAIVQIPAILTMIPAIIIAFSIADTTPAVIFAIYSVVVALSDNFLKPMLLGKGLETPMIVILLGTIGGMLLHGIIGLFVGAVVLAIMHRLYIYWVNTEEEGTIL